MGCNQKLMYYRQTDKNKIFYKILKLLCVIFRMMIRTYRESDRQACLDIFDSNCPKYFAPHERAYLEAWLNHQGKEPKEAAYKNSKADHFYVLEADGILKGCGGFYINVEEEEAVMAWGMVNNADHHKGLGKALYRYRVEKIEELYPGTKIVLYTSQHTFGFFEKLGLKVTTITKDGFGEGLDRYDME